MEALELGWVPKNLVFLAGREDSEPLATIIAKSQDADIMAVSEAILSKISRKDNPQMVLASFKEQWHDSDEVFSSEARCAIALDRIRDPGNLGTIMRTADATSARDILLIGDCCDAYSVESVRASMGAIFNMNLVRLTEDEFIEGCKNWQGKVIATALSENATDYKKADWSAPIMLLLGNEQSGLSPQLIKTADEVISMPMLGRSDSLNVAVAAGVSLYEFLRSNEQK